MSQNSFIPVDPESAKSGKSLKKEYEFNSADEPEIVTAGSLLDNETEPVFIVIVFLKALF